jgi:hypothetical protein
MHDSIDGGKWACFICLQHHEGTKSQASNAQPRFSAALGNALFSRSHDFNLIDGTFLFLLTTYHSCALWLALAVEICHGEHGGYLIMFSGQTKSSNALARTDILQPSRFFDLNPAMPNPPT